MENTKNENNSFSAEKKRKCDKKKAENKVSNQDSEQYACHCHKENQSECQCGCGEHGCKCGEKGCKCGCGENGCKCGCNCGCHCACARKKLCIKIIIGLLIFLAGMGLNQLLHSFRCSVKDAQPAAEAVATKDADKDTVIIITNDSDDKMAKQSDNGLDIYRADIERAKQMSADLEKVRVSEELDCPPDSDCPKCRAARIKKERMQNSLNYSNK